MPRRALALSCTWFFLSGCPLEPHPVPSASCELADCDDGLPCTRDLCDEDGGCRHEPLPEGSPCDADGDACNGIDTCDGAGVCIAGTPIDLDDGDACTVDACDPLTGAVSHVPIEGCTDLVWQGLASAGAPAPRTRHTAVWTGSKMIVWGGDLGFGIGATSSGAIYDPDTDAWTPTSLDGAPTPRFSHTAVWTGREMIVWGGYADGFDATGASYDPATDTWEALPAAPIGGRVGHAAVWTGGEMIVWGGRGGQHGVTPQGNGARYTPSTGKWSLLPGNGPSARFASAVAWTGSELVVWGGTDTFDWLGNGRWLDFGGSAWRSIAAAGALGGRQSASAAWTGSHVLVWGGWSGGPYWNDGALLDLSQDEGGAWSLISDRYAPSPRAQHVSVWTGSELVVWGGCGAEESSEEQCSALRDDGGRYQVAGDTWVPIAASEAFPGRVDATGVWTGRELIVFGGSRGEEIVAGGGRIRW